MLHKMIFSGFGGQGVMMMGKVIAQAGMMENKNVTWLPSYGPEMRGGTANCTVILSDKPIGAPVTEITTEVVAMNIPSVAKFETSLVKNGTLFINTSMGNPGTKRSDINVIEIASNDIADKVGNLRSANIVTIGAFAAKTGIVKKETLYKVIEYIFGSKGQKVVDINKKAIDAGFEFITNYK
jgi:2-oxoglutarate ferredoxin oxidoreductase subunit gamma